jgi:hypothetical protein
MIEADSARTRRLWQCVTGSPAARRRAAIETVRTLTVNVTVTVSVTVTVTVGVPASDWLAR